VLRPLIGVLVLVAVARADTDLTGLVTGAPGCDATRAHCFGIQLHVAVGEAGPIADPAWVARQLAFANKHFEALDVGWQIVGVDALPASAERVEDRKERDGFGKQVKGTVVHVFVTGQLDDVDEEGKTAYGVTWRKKGDAKETKYVILSTQAWERTLAHELGHVFGLPHSTYPISIMNKTERSDPPPDQRRFADEEIAAMKGALVRIVREKRLVTITARS